MIRIKNIKIITDNFIFINGIYQKITNIPPKIIPHEINNHLLKKMVLIEFECNNCDIDWYVITPSLRCYSPNYQSSKNPNQKIFLFPVDPYVDINSLKINGFKRVTESTVHPKLKFICDSKKFRHYLR